METNGTKLSEPNEMEENQKSKHRGVTYIILTSGVTAVAAGVITTMYTKKRANQYLSSLGHIPKQSSESGVALALKALCYSTVMTLSFFTVSIFGLCKLFDINNMDDLRTKLRKQRKPDPEEKTDFESLSDFFNYLNERYKTKEKEK